MTTVLAMMVLSLFVAVAVAATPSGAVIGEYRGVKALSNGENTGKGYPPQYQCVEYIKRFYSQAMGVDTSGWKGNANTYYGQAADRGLLAYSNGGSMSPWPNDILVYGGGTGGWGHVAIITAVRSDSIDVIEQNVNRNSAYRLNIKKSGNTFGSWGSYYVLGWVRKPASPIIPAITVTSPSSGSYWIKGSTQKIQWNYAGNLGSSVKIELLKGTSIIPITYSAPIGNSGKGSYSLWVTQSTGQYKVRVTTNGASAYSIISGVFYIV